MVGGWAPEWDKKLLAVGFHNELMGWSPNASFLICLCLHLCEFGGVTEHPWAIGYEGLEQLLCELSKRGFCSLLQHHMESGSYGRLSGLGTGGIKCLGLQTER